MGSIQFEEYSQGYRKKSSQVANFATQPYVTRFHFKGVQQKKSIARCSLIEKEYICSVSTSIVM
jgi:hypothetical protein